MNMPTVQPHTKNPHGVLPIPAPPAADAVIYYSFNVPFASNLAGPNTEDIVYATTEAVLRWTHPEDAPDDVPIYELPVHASNVSELRKMCKDLTLSHHNVEAHVKSSEPKRAKGQVTNVCLSGTPDLVHKAREKILNETPLALVSLNGFEAETRVLIWVSGALRWTSRVIS
jgi:hypothetical protein